MPAPWNIPSIQGARVCAPNRGASGTKRSCVFSPSAFGAKSRKLLVKELRSLPHRVSLGLSGGRRPREKQPSSDAADAGLGVSADAADAGRIVATLSGRVG